MTPAEFVVAVGLLLGASASTALVVVGLLRRAGEVHPRSRVGAPLRWLVVPTPFALLHRRLRAQVRGLPLGVRTSRRRQPRPVDDLAAEVAALAVAVDRDLVSTARRPWAERRQAWPSLSHRVDQVTALAAEVRALSSTGAPRAGAMDEAEWRERAAIAHRRAAAHHAAALEVEELERRLGSG